MNFEIEQIQWQKQPTRSITVSWYLALRISIATFLS